MYEMLLVSGVRWVVGTTAVAVLCGACAPDVELDTQECLWVCDGWPCRDECGFSGHQCKSGEYCLDGEWVRAQNECNDGNEIPWDGCTAGRLTASYVVSADFGESAEYDLGPYVGVGIGSQGDAWLVWPTDGGVAGAAAWDPSDASLGLERLEVPLGDGPAPRITVHVTESGEVEFDWRSSGDGVAFSGGVIVRSESGEWREAEYFGDQGDSARLTDGTWVAVVDDLSILYGGPYGPLAQTGFALLVDPGAETPWRWRLQNPQPWPGIELGAGCGGGSECSESEGPTGFPWQEQGLALVPLGDERLLVAKRRVECVHTGGVGQCLLLEALETEALLAELHNGDPIRPGYTDNTIESGKRQVLVFNNDVFSVDALEIAGGALLFVVSGTYTDGQGYEEAELHVFKIDLSGELVGEGLSVPLPSCWTGRASIHATSNLAIWGNRGRWAAAGVCPGEERPGFALKGGAELASEVETSWFGQWWMRDQVPLVFSDLSGNWYYVWGVVVPRFLVPEPPFDETRTLKEGVYWERL